MSKKSECVKVVVRCRPMLPDEIAAGYERVVNMAVPRGVVMVSKPKAKKDEAMREFTFDAVYDWNSMQMDLYDETFRSIVDAVLEGYNGTIFAYGQTGTGKTYTMEGIRNKPEEYGVIPNSFGHIFTHISRTHDEQYLIRASYLEIYQEEIRDLLSKDHKKRLELREKPDTGVYVKDLSSFVAKSVKEIEHVMTVGNSNRTVGPTNMNEHSSRSHAIFIVTVECSARGIDGEEHIRVGKLNLVDLAGSERQSKTGSTGERFKEATKINLSLSALGNVISALVDGKSSYVPYRDSKLTRLLQDSLGGNAKTVMVANIGPASFNYDETMMTLRYANRAKNIKNEPHINEDPKDALLREYQEEIQRLKLALDKRKRKGGRKEQRGQDGSDGSGGEDGESEGKERSLKTQQEHLEAEKQALLQNKELLDEERERLVAEVQQKVDQLKKEQKKRDTLAAKIKAMESKLLAGGKNIIDRTDEQKRVLEKRRQEMIEQKCREREIVQQLETKEESALEIRETYSSLQEEVDLKTKKLNKLCSKLKAVRAEMADYRDEQGRVREELALTLDELQRDLKLKSLIVENFIPVEEVERVTGRAYYDEDTDEWKLRPMEPPNEMNETLVDRPVSALGSWRPTSTFAKMAARTGDPRYMAENILKVELDMPNRTTHEYEGPLIAPVVQAALDAALQDEEEITVNAIDTVPISKQKTPGRKARLSQKNSIELQRSPVQQFPASRGLVTPTVRFA